MINLLPYKEKKEIERIRGIRMARTIVIAMVLSCLAGVVLLTPTVMAIRARFTSESAQISALQQKGLLASDIDVASLEKRAVITETKLAAPTTLSAPAYISLINGVIVPLVVVERYAMTGDGRLEVSGKTENREALQRFVQAVKSLPEVDSVDSPVSNFVKNKNSPFKITISFK